jgi:predicted dehydrogenase
MINVGIIGFGKMGQIRYEALRASGRVQIVAISEPMSDGTLVDGVAVQTEPESVLERPDVDAVFICTPNYLNQPLTMRALQAGKHVFCEKPPAFNAAEVEAVQRQEEAAGRVVMYGFNHRQHGSVRKAKALLDSGAYGKLLWMRGRYGKSVSPDFYQSWRAQREFAGGGILIDQGIHMLDVFLMMAGSFDEVHAMVSNLYWKLDVEDNVFAILRNRDGVVASLHSTMTQWRHLFSFEMFLERGYMVINGLLTSSRSYGEEVLTVARNRTTAPAATWEGSEDFHFPVDDSWEVEVGHFLDAISGVAPLEFGTTRDALQLMRVVDRIYESR